MGPWDALVVVVAILAFVALVYIAVKVDDHPARRSVTPTTVNYWEMQKKIYTCPKVKVLSDSLVGFCVKDVNHTGEHTYTFRHLSNGSSYDEDVS